VLCSKSGALPEIAGDAAYYFDSDNIEEIATGLERIVTDNELRSTLTNKGIERVEAFDWELTVAKTLEIAKNILAEK
jgi:glycosyltransferase involved in cell wall biosynthesis